jgi:hypothetical protein
MVGAALFVTAFLVQGWLRPGYSSTSMFVSELSLGPWGWIQVVTFVVSGSLMFVLGRGLGVGLGGGVSGRAGPLLIQIIGIALVASGPFVTDPSTVFNQHSVHGIIHGLFGAVVFSLAPASCLVMYRRFRRDSFWRGFAAATLVVGVGLIVGVILLKLAEQSTSELFAWKGLIQRAILIGFLGWVFTVAARLRITCPT